MDVHAVTNRQYARFVADTGYVTVAERPLDPAEFPGAPPANLVPGSLGSRRVIKGGSFLCADTYCGTGPPPANRR